MNDAPDKTCITTPDGDCVSTEPCMHSVPQPKARRGFAAMSISQRRKLASKGGKTAHAKGVAYEWTRDQAVAAGIKGGLIASEKRRRAKEEAAREAERELYGE